MWQGGWCPDCCGQEQREVNVKTDLDTQQPAGAPPPTPLALLAPHHSTTLHTPHGLFGALTPSHGAHVGTDRSYKFVLSMGEKRTEGATQKKGPHCGWQWPGQPAEMKGLSKTPQDPNQWQKHRRTAGTEE
jgi:hypothetical protein